MLKRIARLPLGLIPKSAAVPVLSGAARGYRWVVGAHTHGCWIGSYEQGFQREFASRIKPGAVVFDIGANAGYYTLIAARAAGPSGRIVCFEPHPENCRLLRRHLTINKIANAEVIEAAVCRQNGRLRFTTNKDRAQNSLSEAGDLEVETVQIDSLWQEGRIPEPTVMKIDVEGAEGEVLEGARQLLAKSSPIIFLATHSEEIRDRCLAILAEFGFAAERLQNHGDGSEFIVRRP